MQRRFNVNVMAGERKQLIQEKIIFLVGTGDLPLKKYLHLLIQILLSKAPSPFFMILSVEGTANRPCQMTLAVTLSDKENV